MMVTRWIPWSIWMFRGTGQHGELAEADEVVQDVAHDIVGGDHGHLGEPVHGLSLDLMLAALVGERGHGRAPGEDKQIVVKH